MAILLRVTMTNQKEGIMVQGKEPEGPIGPVKDSKLFEQLGILVLDGSGSMNDEGETGQTKAQEVNHAVRGLAARLKVSRRAKNFKLALISYDVRVEKNRLQPTDLESVDDNGDYNPTTGHGGGTAIGDALQAAYEVAEDFLSGQTEFPRSVVIVLLSDGQNNSGQDPIAVADKIKNRQKKIAICASWVW